MATKGTAVFKVPKYAREAAREFSALGPAGWETSDLDYNKGARKLIGDSRMKPVWEAGFDVNDLVGALNDWMHAIERRAWDKKTAAAQKEWLRKFESALDEFLSSIEKGPRSLKEWGFPVRDYALVALARRWGLEVPLATEDEIACFERMRELESGARDTGFTLAHALESFRAQVESDCNVEHLIKKPADATSAVRLFCVSFSASRALTQNLDAVAVVANVLFDDLDNALTAADVRRYLEASGFSPETKKS